MIRLGLTVVFVSLLLASCCQAVESQFRPYSYQDDDLPYLVPKEDWWTGKYRPHKVFLSVDGGGLRGIIPTMVLLELENIIKLYILSNMRDFRLANVPLGKTEADYSLNTVEDFHIHLADFFDGIAGISAGSWIATYLSSKGGNGACSVVLRRPSIVNFYGSVKPGAVEGLRVFFLEYGSIIYPTPLSMAKVTPRYWVTPDVQFKLWNGPMYSPQGLEWVLERFLGDVMLSEVATSTLIVTYDLYRSIAVQYIADFIDLPGGQRKPDIYTETCISRSFRRDDPTNDEGDDSKSRYVFEPVETIRSLDYLVRDLGRASSAFPMVHPSKLVKPLNDITYYFDDVDGAMVGNNPTLPMLAWALKHKSLDRVNQTAFLSLGTGYAQGSYEGLSNGGILQWMTPIIDLVTGSTPEYLQSLLDYVFYSPYLHNHCQPNQLLRIQLVRDADTPEGEILTSLTPPRDIVLRMEAMGELLGSQYRANMADFVETFMFKKGEP